MFVLPTAFVLGMVIGRWWAIPLAAVAWFAVTLALAADDVNPSPAVWALQTTPFAAIAAAVGVALRWLLFEPEAVMARARAGGGRLRSWMRAAIAALAGG